MKKLLTIFGIIFGFGVLGFLIFFLFFRTTKPSSDEPLPGGLLPGTGEELPEASRSGGLDEEPAGTNESTGEPTFSPRLSEISSFGIIGYAPLKNGGVRMVGTNGQVSLALPGEDAVTESSNALDRPSRAVFTHDGQKVVVLFGDPAAQQASLFDATAKRWSALPGKILSLAATPNDLRVAYTTETNGKTSIAILNLKDRTPIPSSLFTLSAIDLSLSWPSPNRIILSDRPSALFEGHLLSLSLPSLSLAPIQLDTRGSMALWNPSGENGILFSANTSMRGGSLMLILPTGEAIRSFSFLTLPPKCAFGKISAAEALEIKNATSSTADALVDALYCAIPLDQKKFRTARLPDHYLQKSLVTEDGFYRVSLLDGHVKKMFEPANPIDATSLRVASSSLYFINRYDQKLYSLSLPN